MAKQAEQDTTPIGTSLDQWAKDEPETLNRGWIEELQILKFQTVEQVASASDAQLQRIGMGGTGLRERAKAYLTKKNRSETAEELDNTKKQLAELQAQMAALLADKPKRGRPPKVKEA
jgi:ribosomal protein L29